MSDGEKKNWGGTFKCVRNCFVGVYKKNELNSFGNWAEISYIQIQMCLFQVSSNKTVSTL